MTGQKELTEWRENYLKRLEQCGEELYGKEMPVLTEEDFARFETTGNRLIYEDAYFARRKYLAVFGCLSIFAQGDRSRYLEKLEEIILQICEEECWALPAHVNRREDENWRIYVDLFASETAEALSELSYYLQDELPDHIHKLIYDNVMRRVINPYLGKRPYDKWEQSDMNWNAVCNGSIGIAACYLLGWEKETCREITDRVKDNLKYFIDGFGDDGTCYEGLSYFTYGFYFYIGFWDVYERQINEIGVDVWQRKRLLDGISAEEYEDGLSDRQSSETSDWASSEKCRRIAEFQQKCYFPSGMTLSFSDGYSHDKYRMGLTCKLASVYDTVQLPPLSVSADFDADPCFRFLMILRDLKWTEEYITVIENQKETMHKADCKGRDHTKFTAKSDDMSAAERESCLSRDNGDCNKSENTNWCIVLPKAQWGICHGTSGGGMACKGGHNDEPHNHNDIGSFFYMIGGEMFLSDLGAGEYTKQYFSEGRYEILCNNSFGHNVPIVDGMGQKEGKEYRCSGFEYDGAGMFRFRAEKAYDNAALKKYVRNLHYDRETEHLVIEDVFETTGCVVEENLVTQCRPEIEGSQIILRSEKSACRIIVEQPEAKISVQKEIHSNHEGNAEDVYRMIWTAVKNTDAGETCCRFRIEMLMKH